MNILPDIEHKTRYISTISIPYKDYKIRHQSNE